MNERQRQPPVLCLLLGRMLLLTLLTVLVVQGLSSLFQLSHLRSSQHESLLTSSRSLTYSMAASVSYFCSLPLGCRPLTLDQLRSMGGTRLFVSLNGQPLEMRALPDTPNKQAMLEIAQNVSHRRLDKGIELQAKFISPDELHLFNGTLKLDGLPRSWVHCALTLEPVNPSVLVAQIHIGDSEWLYITSLMPTPCINLEPEGLQPQQALSVVLISLLLLLFAGLLTHWRSRPLKRLARAARDLALSSPSATLEERSANELVEATRTFDTMHEHIDRYLNERGQLFSAISHDLHTPITRLCLRVELLEDEHLQEKFGRDPDELELLVEGVLQCVKDTDIHENVEPVDLNLLLRHIAEPYLADSRMGAVDRAAEPYPDKPLAPKRYTGSLLDNVLEYGERVRLSLEDGPGAVVLHVDDDGPSVPEQRLEQIFEPCFHLFPRGQGYGLDLGIAHNITRTHGDEVSLQNRHEGGLRVSLRLPCLGLERQAGLAGP